MRNKKKLMLGILLFIILYIVSPVDMLPGPVDDILVSLVCTIAEIMIALIKRE